MSDQSKNLLQNNNQKKSELARVKEEREREIAELKETREALLNILEDIEESEKRLSLERDKTKAMLSNLTDGLIVFDREEKIILINPEIESILRLKEKQVLGKRIDQIFGCPNLDQLYQTLGQKIEWTGKKYELTLEKPFRRYFQVTVLPVVSRGKEMIGTMIILHDITREKEIDRMKTEFVSIAAHQLRTPLSALKWTLRTILDGDLGQLRPEQKTFLEKGYGSNERMIELINDLLNVARIEEGRFLHEFSEVSLEELVKEVIKSLRPSIEAKSLDFSFEKPIKPLPKIKVDQDSIQLVIENLLENAISYTPAKGRLRIVLKSIKVGIEVLVEDTGLGIPEAEQKNIFTKFFRGSNIREIQPAGTGLGLFVCKNIIEAHGGRIWFESQENKGTTFHFSLPIK